MLSGGRSGERQGKYEQSTAAASPAVSLPVPPAPLVGEAPAPDEPFPLAPLAPAVTPASRTEDEWPPHDVTTVSQGVVRQSTPPTVMLVCFWHLRSPMLIRMGIMITTSGHGGERSEGDRISVVVGRFGAVVDGFEHGAQTSYAPTVRRKTWGEQIGKRSEPRLAS